MGKLCRGGFTNIPALEFLGLSDTADVEGLDIYLAVLLPAREAL